MTNIVFFDWDGVVVDSQELICEAYEQAGVVAPETILAEEGSDWLVDLVPDSIDRAQILRMKNEYYVKNIRRCAKLGGYDAAYRMTLSPGHRAFVISGAPAATGFHLQRYVSRLFEHMAFGIRTPEKMGVFRNLVTSDPDFHKCTYVDDQAKFILLPEGWKFIQYTDERSLEEIA